MSSPTHTYLKQIYLLHIFIIAFPLLYYGIIGQRTGKIDSFGYTYLTLLGGMALVYHAYWFISTMATGKIL